MESWGNSEKFVSSAWTLYKSSLICRKILENAKPKWTPGVLSGYHAYTYGWLVDQLIRHSDPKKRGVGQFFKEEIADKFGILTSRISQHL